MTDQAKKKSTEMTMAEYAAHRGVSVVAVHKAVKTGRIEPRTVMDGGRIRHYFDAVLCDAMWVFDQGIKSNQNPPRAVGHVGRPTKQHKAALATIHDAMRAEGLPIPIPGRKPHTNNPKPDQDGLISGGRPRSSHYSGHGDTEVTPDKENGLQVRAAVARVKKLEAEAARAQLELEREAKLLVDAETMEDLFAGMVADARDRILSLGSAVKAAFPDVSPDVVRFIGETAMEILATLGKIPERDARDVPERLEVAK